MRTKETAVIVTVHEGQEEIPDSSLVSFRLIIADPTYK